MKALTTKQQRVLDVIIQHRATTGQAPTVREIGRAVGLDSTCSVQRHLEALEKKGFLRRPQRSRHRGLEIVGAAACACGGVELLTDAAGRPWCRGCAGKWLAEVTL